MHTSEWDGDISDSGTAFSGVPLLVPDVGKALFGMKAFSADTSESTEYITFSADGMIR